MSQNRKPRMPPENDSEYREDQIALLLRLAGPRQQAPKQRAQRVRSAFHAEWRDLLQGRNRRRRALWGGLGLVAAASLVVVLLTGTELRQLIAPAELPEGPVGRLEASIGPLRRVSGEEVGEGGIDLRIGDVLMAGWDLATGPGARAALSLGDGSSVRLDTGTRVRLVSSAVLELEAGAVYVDTDPGTGGDEAGLTVRTRLGEIRELGTQFEVRLRAEGVRVRVREGRVHLDDGVETWEGAAGVELELDSEGNLARSAVPIFGPEWAWVLQIAPPFSLEGRTLESFLGWVARETGWRTRFADTGSADAAPGIVLHGSIRGLRPDQALDAVLPTCGLRHRIEKGILIVGSEL